METGLFDIRTCDGRVALPIPHDSVGTVALPNNVYGATKLAQEHVFAAWANANSIPLSILRLQNVFGAGQSVYNSYTGVLTLFHRLAADRQAIEVYEDGHIGRDFIYIHDVVTAFVAALERPPAEMRIVDVGTGVATTIHAAARLIAMAYGAPEPRVSGAFRHGDVRWAVCDPSQLAEQLGVMAAIDFARGTQLLSEWLFETGLLSGKV
jgi:dTDP-L-rhamnose 4-epimerase